MIFINNLLNLYENIKHIIGLLQTLIFNLVNTIINLLTNNYANILLIIGIVSIIVLNTKNIKNYQQEQMIKLYKLEERHLYYSQQLIDAIENNDIKNNKESHNIIQAHKKYIDKLRIQYDKNIFLLQRTHKCMIIQKQYKTRMYLKKILIKELNFSIQKFYIQTIEQLYKIIYNTTN